MTKIKKIIIILGVILLVTIIVLSIILIKAKVNNNNNYRNGQIVSEDEGIEAYTNDTDTNLELVKSREEYYSIQECVGKYYSYYSIIFNANLYYQTDNEQVISEAEKENSEIIYDVLDEEYIKNNNITTSNIKQHLPKIDMVTPDISNMYSSQKTENIKVFVVEGKLKKNVTDKGQDFRIIIKLDIKNNIYSILPTEYVLKMYPDLVVGEKVDINVPESIQANENNKYDYKIIKENTYIQDMLRKLKNELLYEPEIAYEHLDDTYRNKKFGSLEEFKKYIDVNKSDYQALTALSYKQDDINGIMQYVIVDQNNNYYIFNELGIMNFDIILDNYTVDLAMFTKEYNEANEAEKVVLNIGKVFLAIDDGDYKYAYSKLDNTFKQKNFPTLADFEKYVKENFYTNNELTYNNYQTSGNLYIYDVSIKDKTKENNPIITKNFIVQLKDGTDFVMSFNV